MLKFPEQSTCRITFDPPHNLTGCHSGWGTHQNMHMILADFTPYDPYFKRLTDLTNHCSNSFSNFACQYFVAIFCHPNKVILNLKNCIFIILIVHDTPKIKAYYQLKPTVLKPVVLTLWWTIKQFTWFHLILVFWFCYILYKYRKLVFTKDILLPAGYIRKKILRA